MFQETSRLAGTVNWGTATVVGVFAGLLYGGSKEAAASVVSIHFSICLVYSYSMLFMECVLYTKMIGAFMRGWHASLSVKM